MEPDEPTEETEAARQRRVLCLRAGTFSEADDCLVVEEPLEIRLGAERFTVTMRTPGQDFDLTRGLLLTEGIIESAADLGEIRYCDVGDAGEAETDNTVTVRLKRAPPAGRWQRSLMSGASCGLCGKAAIEAVGMHVRPVPDAAPFTREMLLQFPHTMREGQTLFQRTGGLHAVAIFDGAGRCRALAEDIGRHNATDKAIGQGVGQGWLPWRSEREPLALLVSGRASFEITQKALMARIPVVCAVSAASTLAAELADAYNQTLIGFLRDTGMTVYAGRHRVR